MAYAPITKLDKFTNKEDDTQVWLNNIEKAITANRWNDVRAILANTFTTIKQGETEAVTTYLGHFHRNLQQIQAIDANYFTVPQIFNQFIHGLCSSILQHICPLYPTTLQNAVTHARDFKSAKLEVNYAYAVNLVMNRSSELDSKLKQFSDSINQNYVYHYHQQHLISHGSQKHVFATTVISNSESLPKSRSNYLLANDAATNLSTASISTSNLLTTATSNLSVTTPNNLSTPINSDTTPKFRLHSQNSGTSAIQNPNFQNYLSLLVTPEDATNTNSGSNQQLTLTSNIPPATVTEDESLATIFPFEIEEPSGILLFSEATIEEKPITAMYTNTKIDGHSIKLILDSCQVDCAASARIITADRATKTPIGEINNLSIEINGITVSIKILVMEATQYQALVDNNWLFKTNAMLD
ncbi:hypothetical protein G9A89_005129 [Geosiphon pyriformis]|nr:hypothetical protein G9A89_005129 [Geosiphon pyriformis]